MYVVEGLCRILLSFSKITEKCKIVAQDAIAKIYDKNRSELVVAANKKDHLYFVNEYVEDLNVFRRKNSNEIFTNVTELTDKKSGATR